MAFSAMRLGSVATNTGRFFAGQQQTMRTFASASVDVAIIGGGPAGYVASIRASQLGMKTACVEKRKTLGGTCLNVGCIPSKALLHSADMYYNLGSGSLEKNGIALNGTPSIDVGAMMKQKNKAITGLTQGIAGLFKKNKVEHHIGHGTITGPNTIEVKDESGATVSTVEAKNIVIATGSEPSGIPGVQVAIDEERIVTSTGALELKEVPKKLAVIGGGVIGLEMASVWGKLGSEVHIIEYLDNLMPFADAEVSKGFKKIMEKQGNVSFSLSTKVTSVVRNGDTCQVTYEPAKGGDSSTHDCDIVLVATGRRPYTANLGLEGLGIATNRLGQIEVDPVTLKTSVPSIYAVGDAIFGPMLAHKAEEDGVFVVECLAGMHKGHTHAHTYGNVPSVIYTSPEVAWVGKNEEELKAEGVAYGKGLFPFMANSRARAADKGTEGFVKILVCKQTEKILGGHIIAPGAGDMIHPVSIALEYGGSAEDIARTCTSHPTYSEAIKEACLAAYSKPIHM